MQQKIQLAGASKSLFRTDIQALRGVAVLLVVLYHANVPGLQAGYLGVDIFFVISGFLITTLIRKEIEAGHFSFFQFYYRRAKRLLPTAYVVIALTILAAPLFLSALEFEELKMQVLGAVTFSANVVLWRQSGYFDGAAETKALLHFWSLAIEEQYYLLMPAFLFFMPRRAWLPSLAILLVASLSACFVIASIDISAAFYLLPARAWELALGSLAALLPSMIGRRALSWARAPAMVVLIWIPMQPTSFPHPGVDALLVCMATLLIIIGHDGSRWENVASVRALAYLGNFSYSLYLVHWPILVYVRAAWMGDPPVASLWAGVAGSVVVAALLFHFVEEPFRRGFEIGRRPLFGGLVATSVVLCVAPQVLIAANATTVDYDQIRRRNYGLDVKCAFKEGAFEAGLTECRTKESPTVIVWGDSYAMALAPGLQSVVGDLGLEQATSGACGPLLGMAPFSTDPRSHYDRQFAEYCIQFNQKVLNYVVSNEHLEIVVISSPFTAPVNTKNLMLVVSGKELKEVPITIDLAVDGIRKLVAAVRLSGKRIVLVAPPPNGGFDVGDCLERRDRGKIMLGKFADCRIPTEVYESARQETIAFLKRLPTDAAVEVIWPSDFLCSVDTCQTQIGRTFIYRDGGHLSYEGSELFAKEARLLNQIQELAY